jgi:hypothetical protein
MTEAQMSTDNLSTYKITVAAEVLNDLQQRVNRTRWSYQIAGTGWDSGTDVEYLMDLVSYWQHGYDWRTQERALNQFAHFKTNPRVASRNFVTGCLIWDVTAGGRGFSCVSSFMNRKAKASLTPQAAEGRARQLFRL